MIRITLSALALLGTVSFASAQSAGGQYMSVDDMDLMNASGEKIAEIEEVLVGSDGQPAGYLVDLGGFLGMNDRDVVLPLDAVTFSNGNFQTSLSEADLEALPEWDD